MGEKGLSCLIWCKNNSLSRVSDKMFTVPHPRVVLFIGCSPRTGRGRKSHGLLAPCPMLSNSEAGPFRVQSHRDCRTITDSYMNCADDISILAKEWTDISKVTFVSCTVCYMHSLDNTHSLNQFITKNLYNTIYYIDMTYHHGTVCHVYYPLVDGKAVELKLIPYHWNYACNILKCVNQNCYYWISLY